jgi:hypothetical protein
MRSIKEAIVRIAAAIALCSVAGCGGGSSSSPAVYVTVSPLFSQVLEGGKQTLSAAVTGTSDGTVTWTASGGSISSGGVFTAPVTPGVYTITATTKVGLIQSQATVLVGNDTVNIAPSTVTVGANSHNADLFTAIVQGLSNTAVTWSTTGGTVTADGTDSQGNALASFDAPVTTGQYTVTATTVGTPTRSITATVQVVSAGVVAVNPGYTLLATSGPTNTVQLTASITNADGTVDTTTSLTWSIVQGAAGAGFTQGATSRTVTFTAPSSLSSTTTYLIRVLRTDDPTNYAVATIVVQPGTGSIGGGNVG